MLARGGGERRPGTCSGHQHGLSWSPDGKLLAFSDQEKHDDLTSIHLLSLETGEKKKLTAASPLVLNEWHPRFSPDGTTLAFLRGGPGRADIFLIPVAGGKDRPLTVNNRSTQGLDWTPDGKSIVFSSARPGRAGLWSLWRVSTSGGEPEPLDVGEEGQYPTLSRQGGRLAYVRSRDVLNTWRVPGPSAVEETRIPARFIESTALDYFASYSPDGKKISFTSSRSGNLEIWICDSEGTNPRQLTDLMHALTLSGTWSPDGKQIAFMSSKEGSIDIYTISSTGGVPSRFTTETSDEVSPSWSRDGRWIYFASDRSGAMEVWKKPAAGGEAIQATRNGGHYSLESQDGRFLYFGKQGPRGGPPGVWRIPVNGGEEEQILAQVRWGDWTLTGHGMCYINRGAEPGPAIETFEIATRKVNPLAVLEHDPDGLALSASPDGRWILYSVWDSVGSDIMLVKNFR